MKFRNKLGRNRQGTASLELVLGFPFLMLIFAIIIVVGNAGIHKTKTIYDSRYQSWKMRDGRYSSSGLSNVKRVRDTKPMSLVAGWRNHLPGELGGTASNSFRTYRFLGGQVSSKTRSNLIHGTWDYDELTVFSDSPGRSHFEVLEKIIDIQTITGQNFNFSALRIVDRIVGFVL